MYSLAVYLNGGGSGKGDLNTHHNDWLTYSNCEFCCIFLISNNLNQMFNFSTQIPHYDFNSPALLDFYLPSNSSICSTVAFPLLGNSHRIVVSVSIDFSSNSKEIFLFILLHTLRLRYLFSCFPL